MSLFHPAQLPVSEAITETPRALGEQLKIVCFDIGGVLVKHCRSWAEGCEAAGLDLRYGDDCAELVQRRRCLSHQMTCGRITEQQFFDLMAETTGGLYTPEEIERIHHCWLGEEYEGVAEVVERLVTGGRVDTGILSNTNALHWERLMKGADGAYRSPSLPRHRHASHLLQLAKPSPDIYRVFSAQTGYRPDEVLFFEDLPDNVAAAREAGWHAVLVDHSGDTADQLGRVLEHYQLI